MTWTPQQETLENRIAALKNRLEAFEYARTRLNGKQNASDSSMITRALAQNQATIDSLTQQIATALEQSRIK